MNRGRTFLLSLTMVMLSTGAALAGGKEAPPPNPNRIGFKETPGGGYNGYARTIERSWHRPDGAKVYEKLTFGVKTKQFKGGQGTTYVNTGLETLYRTVEGAHLSTTVNRKVKGDDRGTKTEKKWKTNRYDFNLVTSTRPSETPRELTIRDRVTGTTVTFTDKGGKKPEIRLSRYSGGEPDKAQADLMTARGVKILKSRARPERRATKVD